MYVYIYMLFYSLRAHQYSSDQKKILKDQSAQTTATVVSVAYIYIYYIFFTKKVLNIIYNRSI